MITSDRMPMPAMHRGAGHRAHRARSRRGDRRGARSARPRQARAQTRRDRASAPGCIARHDDARHRQIVDRSPLPSHGSQQLRGFLACVNSAHFERCRAAPRHQRRRAAHRARGRGPADGPHLDGDLARDLRPATPPPRRCTSSTAPVVSEARKVMIATTATSARPEIEARGTTGDRLRAVAGTCGRSRPRSTSWRLLVASLIHRYAAVPDAARRRRALILIHQA